MLHALMTLTLAFAPTEAGTGVRSPEAAAAAATEVVAAERAFAGDAPSMGIAGSFNKWSTPDAIIIGDGQAQPVSVAYPDRPRPADEPLLEWWPNFAGASHSGDFGFSTGGVKLGGRRTGQYFTVWNRQADGSWKWVYDGGSGSTAADVPGPETEPEILPAGIERRQSTEATMAEVRAREAELAEAASTDQKAAYLAAMADNGRLYVAPRPPAIGREAFAEALSAWPTTFRFGPTEGGGASTAGDMAWTYGAAAWTRNGEARTGFYVRMWQRQTDGWKIVLAQLVPNPPPPPPPLSSVPAAG
ncbi:DUF4440 domain-containing protein [Brevundimonas sp. Root1423]|uniref:DUF4440 domain-containing protein n=1 Tax=Brevundimonas sp. Root1423 TaxID=1736462 RepID=UPI0006FCFB56|nr:DUF4440 domain-containing protein [Brevundimonas sp. Root1423]KQY89942.1 hypothetical protein ASD25_05355 [Brevundimonas sp. Root1423]